jgi:hypothetical protein
MFPVPDILEAERFSNRMIGYSLIILGLMLVVNNKAGVTHGP